MGDGCRLAAVARFWRANNRCGRNRTLSFSLAECLQHPQKLPIDKSATRDHRCMRRRPIQRQLSQAAKWHQGPLAKTANEPAAVNSVPKPGIRSRTFLSSPAHVGFEDARHRAGGVDRHAGRRDPKSGSRSRDDGSRCRNQRSRSTGILICFGASHPT